MGEGGQKLSNVVPPTFEISSWKREKKLKINKFFYLQFSSFYSYKMIDVLILIHR